MPRAKLLWVSLLLLTLSMVAQAQENSGGIGQRGGMLLRFDECQNPRDDCQSSTVFKGSHALVIGASAYQSWPRLGGVKEDVTAVSDVLKSQGFEVHPIQDPNTQQLRTGIQNFIDQYGTIRDNRLIIYFAGHGFTAPDENGIKTGYIVPVDAPSPDTDRRGFYAHSMSMNHVLLMAKEIQSRHVLFVFDSCFSGSLFMTRDKPKIPEVITFKLSKPVRQFITAGDEAETVPDNSIFRREFIKALDGDADDNHDGYVTGSELGDYLMRRVRVDSRDLQHPLYAKINEPRLNQGDFIFTVKGKSATLYLNSTPESRVEVDGTPINGFPVLDLTVGAGKHSIQFRTDNQAPLTKALSVDVGDVIRCLADFDRREVECRVER